MARSRQLSDHRTTRLQAVTGFLGAEDQPTFAGHIVGAKAQRQACDRDPEARSRTRSQIITGLGWAKIQDALIELAAQRLVAELPLESGMTHIGNPPTKQVRPLPLPARAAQCLCPDARA